MPTVGALLHKIRTQVAELNQAVAEGHEIAARYEKAVEAELAARKHQLIADRDQVVKEADDALTASFQTYIKALDALVREGGPALALTSIEAEDWQYQPATEPPAAIRIGTFSLGSGQWCASTPAILPFTRGRNLIIRGKGAELSLAIDGVQAAMLRLLALVPPAKLRLLMIDPVGLGDNLSVFMNLLEYMPELVSDKVWVERADIERQLTDLSAHMEAVIQTYLRGHYQSMEEYNAEAGEVAEPYRLAVILNFPANFTEEAAQRLVTILRNGPRCGVQTLVVWDETYKLPHGVEADALLEGAELIEANDDLTFTWDDPILKEGPLTFNVPPDQAVTESLLQAVGKAAKAASRVELPFAKVAPAPEHWWQASSADGLMAAIGRAGARHIQYFEVGHGTTHHALVAGRTGSGKSTLMHTLITSLATTYSPDELELYLIDFKEGIEFQDYARYSLPHARVVAIAGEREFGYSVLQGLDAELQRRGQAFQAAGAHNIAEYRAGGARTVPRILLVIDEFQQFFAQDDFIARQAVVLLDRLARQGRSFGMHVLLGSQSISGSGQLARTTIDQLAVRMVLQTSDADSRLALAEDNPAARLLNRSGEAIYNAAAGQKEGNVRFQVAIAHEAERQALLAQIRALAEKSGRRDRRPIVFDGNAVAGLEQAPEHPLAALVALPDWPVLRAARVWLGEPVELKPPTAAAFGRSRGRNLAIVGRDEKLATGMVAAALVSLGVQYRPAAAEIYLADLAVTHDPAYHEVLAAAFPGTVRLVPPRRLTGLVAELAETVARRVAEENPRGPEIFLVISGLHRARDLRRDEEAAYRRRPDDPPTPDAQLAAILRDGPEVGVHLISWSDTIGSLQEVFDRRAWGEFGMRTALPMTDRESEETIGSPAASRLNPYRALYFDDEKPGLLEKFRPYGQPDAAWIQAIGVQIQQRQH